MKQNATEMNVGMTIYMRSGKEPESQFEKPVILPKAENQNPVAHAWADARFAVDTMAEHALFFALLMPPEVAGEERAEALRFNKIFTDLYQQIDANPPDGSELKGFVNNVVEQIKPFIEYKARLGEAQTSGKLRSLVWTLFFDHTRHEAERWVSRLETLAHRESELDKDEVSIFWTNIMDDFAQQPFDSFLSRAAFGNLRLQCFVRHS